jgi:hypothetical protein
MSLLRKPPFVQHIGHHLKSTAWVLQKPVAIVRPFATGLRNMANPKPSTMAEKSDLGRGYPLDADHGAIT